MGVPLFGGTVNKPFKSVSPGLKEGFASHKTGHTATGSQIFCPFNVDTENRKYRVMFMYSVPFNQNHHMNQLAVAVCHLRYDNCKELNGYSLETVSLDIAEWMNTYISSVREEDKEHPLPLSIVGLDRHDYYYTIRSVKACLEDVCFMGEMGSSHRPEISMRMMPKNYEGLSEAVKGKAQKDNWGKEQYEKFVTHL